MNHLKEKFIRWLDQLSSKNKEKKRVLEELNKQEKELFSHQKIISDQEEKFKKKASELQELISNGLKDGKPK